MPPTTGNGGSVTFSGGFTANVETIELMEQTCGKIPASHLLTTGEFEYIPEDLTEPGGFKITFQSVPNTRPTLKTVQTGTVTYPSGKTLSGTGFVTSYKPPGMENSKKLIGECTFEFDGYTGPTWSA